MTNKTAISWILSISAIATTFLIWLIYFQEGAMFNIDVTFLPKLNAILNGLSAICLLTGFYFIRQRQIKLHLSFMSLAFVFSTLFLISYIIYHSVHGDTPFTGQGIIRPIYFFILITHIGLSIVALPMILTTFFFSLTKRFPMHKKIARITLPIWLYVSVTGVLVYWFLKTFS